MPTSAPAPAPTPDARRADGPSLLARWRAARALSQNKLAKLSNVDAAYVNQIERRLGRRSPSRVVVLRFCAALGLDLAQGDRLLYAFGLAPRVDWQAAWERARAAVIVLPVVVASGVAEAVARALDEARSDAERMTDDDADDSAGAA